MHRRARALPSALALLAFTAAATLAAGPPFPDPIEGRAVYDDAGILRPEVVAELEGRIDAVEAATGAEIVVYTQVDPGLSEDQNLAKAAALIDQWGVGRSGFDDGLALLIGLEEDRVHGKVSLFGGSGFTAQHIDEDGLQRIVDDRFVPRARDGDLNGATLDAIDAVQEQMAPDTVPLTAARVLNAALGLIGAPLALLVTLGGAYWKWRREGDDPDLVDSPSILMAGPPAEMTPPLATVVRRGRADGHSVNTVLAELASTGRISFENLERVSEVRSDDEPDPMTDPAIVVHGESDGRPLAAPQGQAWDAIRRLGGGDGRLSRTSLWRLNDELGSVKKTLESEATRIGWFARPPSGAINAMSGVGASVLIGGIGAIALGFVMPMSGAVLFGAALVLGGIGVIGFGQAMSKRTPQGAYVDAMLKAYRRTLQKTMDQARSMGEVVEQPDVARLADSPDRAVLWGLALGLHDEVAAVLARGLEDQARTTGSPAGAYYPVWLGSASGSTWDGASAADLPGGVSYGSGSIFSGSAIPDIGGMFDALGSVGSPPPSSSSSSSGGGFSGGSSSGGGGGSGSF